MRSNHESIKTAGHPISSKNRKKPHGPEFERPDPPFAGLLGRSFIWTGDLPSSSLGESPRKGQSYTLELIYVGAEHGELAYKANFKELPPPEGRTAWCLSGFRLLDGDQFMETHRVPELPCSSLRCSLPCYEPEYPARGRVVKVMHPELRTVIHLHVPN